MRIRKLIHQSSARPDLVADADAMLEAAIEADRQHAVIARWVEGSIACRNFRPEYAFYAKRASGTAF